jgi:Tfp pilus assembly protein PilN
MSAHIAERLTHMLILTAEIQADLENDAGAAARSLQSDIDHLAERIDALLQRLAS